MTLYRIILRGCDDSTIWRQDLDEAGLAMLQQVANRSQEASQYSCEPTLLLTREDEIEKCQLCDLDVSDDYESGIPRWKIGEAVRENRRVLCLSCYCAEKEQRDESKTS